MWAAAVSTLGRRGAVWFLIQCFWLSGVTALGTSVLLSTFPPTRGVTFLVGNVIGATDNPWFTTAAAVSGVTIVMLVWMWTVTHLIPVEKVPVSLLTQFCATALLVSVFYLGWSGVLFPTIVPLAAVTAAVYLRRR